MKKSTLAFFCILAAATLFSLTVWWGTEGREEHTPPLPPVARVQGEGRLAIVPDTLAAYQVMHDHRSRITFEFGPQDEQYVAGLAAHRGVQVRVVVE